MLEHNKRDNRNLSINIFFTFVIKGAAIIISVLMTPSYIRYFNDNTVLGSWFTIVAILNCIIAFDYGVGNGLRNKLVEAFARNDKEEAKKLISSAYVAIGFISLFVITLMMILIYPIDWNDLLGIMETQAGRKDLSLAIIILLAGTVINFLLKLITSVLYAMQKTAIPNFLTLITSLSMLLFIKFATFDTLCDKLINAAIAQSVFLNLPMFVATIIVFGKMLSYAKPSIKSFDYQSAKGIVSLGGLFFVIQLGLLVLNSTNEILITLLYTASDVVEYQIYFKLYFMIVTILSLVTQPIWSAVTKANNEFNIRRIQNLYWIVLAVAAVGMVCAVVLSLGLQAVLDLWLGDTTIIMDYSIAFAFTVLVSEQLFINASTTIANGVGRLKCQVIFTSIAAALKIPIVFLLGNYYSEWSAIVWINVTLLIPLLIAQSVSTYNYIRNANRHIRQ